MQELLSSNFLTPTMVQKDWGYELIIHNDEKYCGKILFIKKDHCISLQFHKKKTETFYLQSGELLCKFSEQEDFISPEQMKIVKMYGGQVKEIPVGFIHQVFAVEDSTIIEFSTQHFDDDTYRISKSF
jgi:mannose-6-phosphate isomerase-like protein (cupin superfamily)